MTRRMWWTHALSGAMALCLAWVSSHPAVQGAGSQGTVPAFNVWPPRSPPHYPPLREPPDRVFCTNTRFQEAYLECRQNIFWLVTDEHWRCPPDAVVAVRKHEVPFPDEWCSTLRSEPAEERFRTMWQSFLGFRGVTTEFQPGQRDYLVFNVCSSATGTWWRAVYESHPHPTYGFQRGRRLSELDEDTGVPCGQTPPPVTLPVPPRTGMSTGTKVALGAAGAGAVGLGLALRGGSSTPATPAPTPAPTPPPFTPAGTYTCTITVTSDPGNFAPFIELAPNPPLAVSTGPPFAISGPSGSNWTTVSGSHDAASGAFNLTGPGASGTTAVFQGTLRPPGAIEGSYTVSHPNWSTPVVYRVVCQKQ